MSWTYRRPFLTAEWRYLSMLNYTVDPSLLRPYLPAGVELDTWNDLHTVSLVAFHFRNTRVVGVPIPFHRNFLEVNLRFYVRYQVGGELRRGVVFIRELVPRFFIAQTARLFYNEPYSALPMEHCFKFEADDPELPTQLYYQWGKAEQLCSLTVNVRGRATPISAGAESEFITEHYWGYNRQRNGSTMQYRVDHPRWQTWNSVNAELTGSHAVFYGSEFDRLLQMAPRSVLVADGSAVSVYSGIPL